MNFKFIANACGIFEGSRGTKILCDPWIKNGVFEGSWHHIPPIKTRIDDLTKVDAIYVSHLLPDHFDTRTFKTFDPSTPIIILERNPNFLSIILSKLGFNNLLKIENYKKIKFKEFEITMLEPFEKHINFNDNIPSVSAAKKIKKKFKNIDLALVNYNAAGPYPSCFENLNTKNKISENNRIINRNLNHTLKIVENLKPKSIMPFAGSYILGGKNHKKNNFLGSTTPSVCAEFLNKKISFNSKVFCLNEGEYINLKDLKLSKEYKNFSIKKKTQYIKKISKIKYEYEREKNPNIYKLICDVKTAQENMNKKIKKLKIKVKSNVYINIKNKKIRVMSGNKNLNLECKLDLRLLRRILDKKAHWNNAEVGAHIDFKRNPNKADIDAHVCMSFFHL